MEAALDLLAPGTTLYLPGASGESDVLASALARDPDRLDGVRIVSCPFPGINTTDYAGLHPRATSTIFLPPAQTMSSILEGRTRVLPLAYSRIMTWLRNDAGLDVAVAHVAPPNNEGLCSLGVAADFTPAAWCAAKRRILLVNPAMPTAKWGPYLNVSSANVVIDAPGPVVTVKAPVADATSVSVARNAAALVPDEAFFQIGLGTAPGAVWQCLTEHKGLTLSSGLVADACLRLYEAGVMKEGDHIAGVALGGGDLMRFIQEVDCVRMAPVTETHDVARMAGLPRFTAINGALEVDLFGQVNLEWQNGRMVSGVGGAPDFVAGARASKGGRAMTLLPSKTRGGASRIVLRLDMPPSLDRRAADTIVTEHGVAELRDRAPDARAEALIAIAAPEHRNTLAAAWDDMRRQMWKVGK